MTIRLLYDGWAWAHQPNSPAVYHLLTLLAHLPAPVEATVALPEVPRFALPEGAHAQILSTAEPESSRLRWEQQVLPRIARRIGAELVHLFSLTPALWGSVPVVISPCEWEQGHLAPGLRGRLRAALAQGGLSRGPGILWPQDLPPMPGHLKVHALPPVIHPAVQAPGESVALDNWDTSRSYVLALPPPNLESCVRLLEVWGWAARVLGSDFTLFLLGVEEQTQTQVEALRMGQEWGETVQLLPPLPFPQVAALLRGCSALLQPFPAPAWGSLEREAMACARPIVGIETPQTDRLFGPAAYLVPPQKSWQDTSRLLGAGLLTCLVEESVGEALGQAARQRAENYQGERFSQELLALYQSRAKK